MDSFLQILVLAQAPDDVDAFQCKLVALIQQDKFDEVLKVLASRKDRASYVFEEAYALYRLKKLPESLALIEKTSQTDKRALELKAQVVRFLNFHLF